MRPRENEFGIFPKNIRGSIIYYFWVYDTNGKRRFRSTRKKEFDDAVKYCRSLQVKGQLLKKTPLSFSTYTENFFDYEKSAYINHRLSRGYTYSSDWAKRQKKLLETVIMQHFEQKDLNSITFNDIDVFIMSLKKHNFNNKKINHIITTLKNIFNYAEMNEVILTNPCKNIKPFKVSSPEKGILTKTEIEALFDKEKISQIWPEKMHFIINYLAYSTGVRLGEILALTPNDFTNNTLIVSHSYNRGDGLKSTKNGKTRSIPLEKKLDILLTDYCQGKKKDAFIFSSNGGISPMDHKTIYIRFWKALEIIGIDEAERKRRNITFNSYRHGMNTRLLELGLAPETVRLLTGHSASMTARYSHIQLSNIISNQDNLVECPELKNARYIVPNYIPDLVNKGLLYPDGKRVIKSLDNVALEMQKLNITPTENQLMELFAKPNGQKYSLKACKKAVIFSNTN